MDERESQYIRKMYEIISYYNNYQMGYGSGFDLTQFSLVGHPTSLMNNMSPSNPQPPPGMVVPPVMMKGGNNPNLTLASR